MSDNQQSSVEPVSGRKVRADAQRNLDMLLEAAKEVFANQGMDAPVRDIAERAGVGVGTLYRHFPKRTDLVAAVFSQEIDACVDAADSLASQHPPLEALQKWMHGFVALASTKRGLAEALHSGDPAFDFMPVKREQRLFPAARKLFNAASDAGDIRSDVDADEFLNAAAMLCSLGDSRADLSLQLVMILLDGLRYRAGEGGSSSTR